MREAGEEKKKKRREEKRKEKGDGVLRVSWD